MNTKNMKKIILISIFILTLIVLLMINTMSSLANNPSDFDFDSSTGTITGYSGDGGEIIIPDEIDIDYIPPVITIEPYIKTPTNQDITVTAKVNEGTLEQSSYTFTENGIFTFRTTDEANNTIMKTVEITNIDKNFPTINVERDIDNTIFTNQSYNLNATFTDNEFGIKKITLPDNTILTFDLDETNLENALVLVSKNGTYTFSVEDFAGNIVSKDIEVINIDTLAPQEPIVSLNPSDPTNTDVTITVSGTDTVATTESAESGIDYIKDLQDNQTYSGSSHYFVVSVNGTYSYEVYDKAGNKIRTDVTVSNIDKVAPVITVEDYIKIPTNQDITVTLHADKGEFEDDSSGLVLENDAKTVRYTFTENGTKDFTAKDIDGNETTKTITINNIDKDEPSIQYTTSTEAKTNKPYNINFKISDNGVAGIKEILTPDPNKNITFETPQKSCTFNYIVSENGTYKFKVVDFVGNESNVSIPVNNINSIVPTISITKSIETITNKSVVVTATAKDALGNDITSKLNKIEFTFIANGSFEFIVVDDWGNETRETVVIDNIDLTPPEAPTASADKTTPTNTDVIITAIFSEDSILKQYNKDENGWINYVDGVVFTKNGSVKFRGQDEAGNCSDETIYTVDNIDTTDPYLDITFNKDEWYKDSFDVVLTINDNIGEEYNSGLLKLVYPDNSEKLFEDNPLNYDNII